MKIELSKLFGDKLQVSDDIYQESTVDITHEQIIAIWEIMGFIKHLS